MSASTIIIVSLFYGNLIGLVSCMTFAIFVKRFNLGLFANAATGILVGGPMLLAAVMADLPLGAIIAASIIGSILAMTTIGRYLNHRAR
ncbi:hypothetical protein N9M66_03540 [Litoreibacter sp.]|nr:hypothetical protein [Litoreibacter sp.]